MYDDLLSGQLQERLHFKYVCKSVQSSLLSVFIQECELVFLAKRWTRDL